MAQVLPLQNVWEMLTPHQILKDCLCLSETCGTLSRVSSGFSTLPDAQSLFQLASDTKLLRKYQSELFAMGPVQFS